MKNLLIIMADELRHDITLHTKYPFVKLPNLDRLRREGITAANCFCQYPVCCPSRASFTSGKYPHQIGVWNNGCSFPAHERDLGHHLQEHTTRTTAENSTILRKIPVKPELSTPRRNVNRSVSSLSREFLNTFCRTSQPHSKGKMVFSGEWIRTQGSNLKSLSN